MTNEEYHRRSQVSSREAHRAVFDEYFNYVYTIVFNRLRSCASREDIEECVCDVFAEFYRCYDYSKAPDGDISGFIGVLARRMASARYRKNSAGAETVPLEDEACKVSDPAADTENEVEGKELRRIILDSIAALGEPDSTIILMKYYYGRSAKEIAGAVSLTPENVRVRSGRAVKKLGDILKKAGISL